MSDTNVIRCLLRQFLSHLDTIPIALELLYDNSLRHSTTPDQAALMRHLISSTNTFDYAFVVLDALDECSAEALGAAISLIGRLKESEVKIFVSGRPYASNTLSLLDNPPEIVIRTNEEDIRKYLSDRLNKEWRYGEISRQRILDSVANRVIERTGEKYLTHDFDESADETDS
jgi:hypothetical protein